MTDQTQVQIPSQGKLDWTIPSVQKSNKSAEPRKNPPDGVYDLVIASVSDPFETTFTDGSRKNQSIIEFQIENDAEWAGTRVKGWYTISMNEMAKLYKLSKVIFGPNLPTTEDINPWYLMGKRLRGVIETPELTEEQIQSGKTAWPKMTKPMAVPGYNPYELTVTVPDGDLPPF